MWLARLKPTAALAAALMLVTVGVVARGRQQPPPEGGGQIKKVQVIAPRQESAPAPDAAIRALCKEQLALIDRALVGLRKLAERAEVSPTDPEISRWELRRLEVLRKSGAEKAEIVAALKAYIDTLKREEAGAQRMFENAQSTLIKVDDARFRRIEAEIWLNEENAR